MKPKGENKLYYVNVIIVGMGVKTVKNAASKTSLLHIAT